MLMDVGVLALDLVLGEQYAAVLTQTKSHDELAAAERAALGTDHVQVVAALVERWKLPPLLSIPIVAHNDPSTVEDETLRTLTALIALGGRCADVLVDADPAAAVADVRQRGQELGLTEAQCDSILEDVAKRSAEVAELFDVEVGAVRPYLGAVIEKSFVAPGPAAETASSVTALSTASEASLPVRITGSSGRMPRM